MNDADLLLLELFERQHGFITRVQARTGGMSPGAVRWRTRSGRWGTAGPRVLTQPGVPRSKARPLMLATLDAGPGAVLSGPTAAAWWGLPGFDLRTIHVTRPRGITGSDPLFAHVLHEVLDLGTNQVTVLDGIPIVRPERMAFDLFATVRPGRAVRAIENAWARRLLSGRSLRATFEELAERGRMGTVLCREFLDQHPDDWVPPASNLEARAIQVIEAGVVHGWRRQVNVGGEHRWTGRVDLLSEHAPLVVEVQSERYHSALLDVAADAARRRQLEADGFVVVEIWDNDVWLHPEVVVAAVRDGLRRAMSRRAA